jgi:hypothetical protein
MIKRVDNPSLLGGGSKRFTEFEKVGQNEFAELVSMGGRSWMVLCGLEIAYKVLVRGQVFDGGNSWNPVSKMTRIVETIV